MMNKYVATKCPCGHRACNDWHVEPVAAVQGVKFTEEQARYVAGCLNEMEEQKVICMCGAPIESHTMGDGHSPVSQWDYHHNGADDGDARNPYPKWGE